MFPPFFYIMSDFNKKPTYRDYMHLTEGAKVLVIGHGINRNKIGYVVGSTDCHYSLFFMDGQSAQVWRQNVRLIDCDNQTVSTAKENKPKEHRDLFKEGLQKRLSQAIARLQSTTQEITDLTHQLTGVKAENLSPKRANAKRG